MGAHARNTILCIALAVLVSGCASQPDTSRFCGTVSVYSEPDPAQNVYRVVVTHLNGKPVISKPNYRLPPGTYEFTLAELIHSPELKVKLVARTPKVLSVTVKTNQRYHLAAKFNTDKIYRGNNTDFWQPEIWRQEKHQCELPKVK
ncbi:MAG: hypothetical protein ACI8SK_000065 [Shewanella sp.]|jgi:hypothetical protein